MSAQALQFPDVLQMPVEAGVISPETAWSLMWEWAVLQGQPWTPGVYEMNQRVLLFHHEMPGPMQ